MILDLLVIVFIKNNFRTYILKSNINIYHTEGGNSSPNETKNEKRLSHRGFSK